MPNRNTLPKVGRTILDKLLLDYINTLDIVYVGRRCAKIKFIGSCRKHQLERKLMKPGYAEGYSFDCLRDFNCNGKQTTATVRLLSNSKPFYELKTTPDAKS